MITFDDVLNEHMKNPEFKREWEIASPLFELWRATILFKNENNVSYKDLSRLTNIPKKRLKKFLKDMEPVSLEEASALAWTLGKTISIQ